MTHVSVNPATQLGIVSDRSPVFQGNIKSSTVRPRGGSREREKRQQFMNTWVRAGNRIPQHGQQILIDREAST